VVHYEPTRSWTRKVHHTPGRDPGGGQDHGLVPGELRHPTGVNAAGGPLLHSGEATEFPTIVSETYSGRSGPPPQIAA
jgi:hypothetical protein